jgi:hypothetical protein
MATLTNQKFSGKNYNTYNTWKQRMLAILRTGACRMLFWAQVLIPRLQVKTGTSLMAKTERP